jgi:predicted nucleic acid-binding protein
MSPMVMMCGTLVCIWISTSMEQEFEVTTHYQRRPQLRDPADEMVLEAAANAQAHAIVTYNLRDFGPAKLFGIPVLNPEQTFQHFGLTVTRSSKP